MRLLLINTVYAEGSTGKIVDQIAKMAENSGIQCMIAHRYERKNKVYPPNVVAVSSWLDCHIHNRFSQLFMLRGVFSKVKTYQFLKKVDSFAPDIIHLHNVSGNYINLAMLFRYIKKNRIKLIWTFHDCWPLTGNCKHFDMIGCEKWKYGCGGCVQKGKAVIDISSLMYRYKKKMFSNIENATIVTPSQWLADLVRHSPLQCYPIKVINNGIDLNVFKPTVSNKSQSLKKTGMKTVLGVAFGWGRRKGLDIFIELAKRLPGDYQILLVGVDSQTDEELPANIISVCKTADQRELAAIYTAADVFVNPTREDNFPTVNIESLACGTPVITYSTGGSPEMVDETCGCVVERENIEAMTKQIIRVCEKKPFSEKACLKKAKQYDMNDKFNEYIQLYKELK